MTDTVQYRTNVKWKWAGHVAQTKDSRTIGSRKWQVKGVRSVGGPTCRQRGDAVEQLGSVLKRVGENRTKDGLWWRATSCSGRTQPR